MALHSLNPKVRPARMYMVRALVVLALGSCVVANTKYCSDNLIPSDTTYMQFTKEPVVEDYGYPNLIKAIHCCVKGYWSIEWFKDGLPYPWPASRSNFILYPESGNQTLYAHRPQLSDAGNYVCRVSNRTYTMKHNIKLEMMSRITDAPKMLYVSPDTIVEEGKPLRLFCEAILGRKFLADAPFELRWWKVAPNSTVEKDLLPTQFEHNTTREDVISIIGSYLIVDSMAPQDYGCFLCTVRCNAVVVRNFVLVSRPIPVERKTSWHVGKVPRRVLILAAALLLIFGIALVALHHRITPHLFLFARYLRSLVATRAQRARGLTGIIAAGYSVLEKEFDVLVCWTPIDREIVSGALLPTLQLKYRYRVLPLGIPFDITTWYGELLTNCSRCRSLVVVMSPTQHTPFHLLMAFRQLRALPLPPVVVLLQDLPDLRQLAKDSGETLVELFRGMRLVPWRNVQDPEFWTAMRLALPLPPMPQPESPLSVLRQFQAGGNLGDVYNTGSQTALM